MTSKKSTPRQVTKRVIKPVAKVPTERRVIKRPAR